MKILRKYVLKEFIVSFIYILCFWCMIFLVSEFFFRLPDFLHHKLNPTLIFYYLIRHIPLWLRDSSPISVLSGILFSFGRLCRDNEITAIKSSGINLYNVIAPIIFVGLILSAFGIFLNTTLVPNTYVEVTNIRKYKMKGIKPRVPTRWYNLVFSGSKGEKFTIGSFDYKKKEMTNVTIDYISPDFVLTKQIKVKKMTYRDDKWILSDGVEQIFDPASKELVQERKIITKELSILDKPKDFLPSMIKPEEMSLSRLQKEINRLKKHGMKYKKQLVEYHFRFAYSFSNLIVVFFAIAFGLGLGGGRKYGRIRNIVYVISISAAYWIFVSISRSLSTAEIVPVFLGVWSGNIIFLIIGITLFLHVHR